ncbi:MAG: LptF/LptG family permease [Candidatus Kaelpia aquatica]|nr:LptF/LptG family permease [Candidatus Kaelpia aquatica]
MRKIEQYIFQKIIAPFIFCFILISSIYIIVDLSTNLEHIIRNQVQIDIVVFYYLYSLPRIIFEITPICLLVAAIYSLTKMNRANEITAMRAAGINFFTILKPYFTIAIILVVLMFLNHEKIIPHSYKKLKDIGYILEGKKKQMLHKNITFYAEGNRIVFAKEFYPDDKLLNDVVILEQNLDKRVLYKITAESAHYRDGNWSLYNTTIFKLNPQGTGVEEAITLTKKDYDLKENPEEILMTDMELTYQPFRSLLKKISTFKGISREIIKRLRVELYHKLSFPFTNIILLLFGLFVGLNSRQASMMKGLGIALLIGFIYYSLDAFAYSLGKIGLLPPPIAGFFANIFFLTIGGYLLIKTIRS